MSAELLSHQKAQALNALAKLTLTLTHDGNWCASLHRAEIKQGSCLASCNGFASSPYGAVNELWSNIGESVVVIEAMTDKRREVSWNGFMWVDEP